MNRSISERYFATAILSAIVFGACHAAADERDDVVAAWKRRQEATRTVNARIDELNSFAPGVMSGLRPEAFRQLPQVPVKETTKNVARAIILDGDKMLHSIAGETWLPSADHFLPDKMISVCDGMIARTVHIRDEQTDAVHSAGFIHDKAVHPDRWNLFLAPVLRHYRPLSAQLGTFDPAKWEILKTDAIVDDVPCIQIREATDTVHRHHLLWVDPAKDMSLVRLETHFEGRLASRLAVKHRLDAKHGWVPESWEVFRYTNGKLINSGVCVLVDLKRNEGVDDATFNLEFPPATFVTDYATSEAFIVRPDGTAYEVTEADRKNRLTYTQLVRKSQEPHEREGSAVWLILGVLAFGLYSAYMWVLIRRSWSGTSSRPWVTVGTGCWSAIAISQSLLPKR